MSRELSTGLVYCIGFVVFLFGSFACYYANKDEDEGLATSVEASVITALFWPIVAACIVVAAPFVGIAKAIDAAKAKQAKQLELEQQEYVKDFNSTVGSTLTAKVTPEQMYDGIKK